jgi:proteasome lid subunit RPN8/RPN11
VEPSQLDLEHAWPNFTYLILSLQNGEPRDFAAWILTPDGTAFARDEVQIV